jgi:hypothetical protein
MLNANIDIFDMSYEESVSNFKFLENLEKIEPTNSPGEATIPVITKNIVFVSIIVSKYSNNPKAFNM